MSVAAPEVVSKCNKHWKVVRDAEYVWPFFVMRGEKVKQYDLKVPTVDLSNDNFYDCLAERFKLAKGQFATYSTAKDVK